MNRTATIPTESLTFIEIIPISPPFSFGLPLTQPALSVLRWHLAKGLLWFAKKARAVRRSKALSANELGITDTRLNQRSISFERTLLLEIT